MVSLRFHFFLISSMILVSPGVPRWSGSRVHIFPAGGSGHWVGEYGGQGYHILTNVSHVGPPGPVCLARNLHIQQKVYELISHTVLHFCYFLYRLRRRTLRPLCSRLKWRSLVFNGCFTFSACSASVMAIYIFLRLLRKISA